jgi:F1F0 ATPase subunit 2
MILTALIERGPFATASLIIAAFAGGAFLGAVHYALLWHSVKTLICHGSLLHALGAQTMRLIVVTAGLAMVGREGALPLLVALAAFLVTRVAAIRRIGMAP